MPPTGFIGRNGGDLESLGVCLFIGKVAMLKSEKLWHAVTELKAMK
jgi:hypothetical protein